MILSSIEDPWLEVELPAYSRKAKAKTSIRMVQVVIANGVYQSGCYWSIDAKPVMDFAAQPAVEEASLLSMLRTLVEKICVSKGAQAIVKILKGTYESLSQLVEHFASALDEEGSELVLSVKQTLSAMQAEPVSA